MINHLASYKCIAKYFIRLCKKKVGDHSRGWPEGSLFDSLLHQGVGEGATPFPKFIYPYKVTYTKSYLKLHCPVSKAYNTVRQTVSSVEE